MQRRRDTTLISLQDSPSNHCHREVFIAFQQPTMQVAEGLGGDRLCATLQAAGLHPWAGRKAGKFEKCRAWSGLENNCCSPTLHLIVLPSDWVTWGLWFTCHVRGKTWQLRQIEWSASGVNVTLDIMWSKDDFISSICCRIVMDLPLTQIVVQYITNTERLNPSSIPLWASCLSSCQARWRQCSGSICPCSWPTLQAALQDDQIIPRKSLKVQNSTLSIVMFCKYTDKWGKHAVGGEAVRWWHLLSVLYGLLSCCWLHDVLLIMFLANCLERHKGTMFVFTN